MCWPANGSSPRRAWNWLWARVVVDLLAAALETAAAEHDDRAPQVKFAATSCSRGSRP